MKRVLATCDRCGTVELADPAAIVVRRCVDTGQIDYRFRCPICAMFVVRPLGPYYGDLVMAGARVEQWQLPRELFERPGGEIAAICADDLIDFHVELDRLPTASARARARGGS